MGDTFQETWPRAEASLWGVTLLFLRDAQRVRIVVQVGVLVGGLAAGAAQFFADDPNPATKSLWHWVGVIGVIFVTCFGLLGLSTERSFNALMTEAKDAVSGWQDSEVQRARMEDRHADVVRQLRELEDRNIQFDVILNFLYQTLSLRGVSADRRLADFTNTAGPRLIGPLKLASDADWTISVFRPKLYKSKLVMCRIGTSWKDQSQSKKDNRRWPIGVGWTGEAWRKAAEKHDFPWVIERDAASSDARARYNTTGFEKPDDYTRFQSVAAIPFYDTDGSVAGIVTVTSGRVDIFSREEGTQGARNFQTLVSFTRIVAALVASET
jgi:hypothetical protein